MRNKKRADFSLRRYHHLMVAHLPLGVKSASFPRVGAPVNPQFQNRPLIHLWLDTERTILMIGQQIHQILHLRIFMTIWRLEKMAFSRASHGQSSTLRSNSDTVRDPRNVGCIVQSKLVLFREAEYVAESNYFRSLHRNTEKITSGWKSFVSSSAMTSN